MEPKGVLELLHRFLYGSKPPRWEEVFPVVRSEDDDHSRALRSDLFAKERPAVRLVILPLSARYCDSDIVGSLVIRLGSLVKPLDQPTFADPHEVVCEPNG